MSQIIKPKYGESLLPKKVRGFIYPTRTKPENIKRFKVADGKWIEFDAKLSQTEIDSRIEKNIFLYAK
jgi:hypothetical protein